MLFDEAGCERLRQLTRVGERVLLMLRSDEDALLQLPWELLHDGTEFLVRAGTLDLVRSTLDEVSQAALLRESVGPFRLVVNVAAPAGNALDCEAESYQLVGGVDEQP